MLRYIYYRLCRHHEKGKRRNEIGFFEDRFFLGIILCLLTPVFVLLFSILEYNTFTAILAGIICFALVFTVEHHITNGMKTYRPPKRWKVFNKLSVQALEWIILPLEIIYAIGSLYLTVTYITVPLNLDGLLARWLSGIF